MSGNADAVAAAPKLQGRVRRGACLPGTPKGTDSLGETSGGPSPGIKLLQLKGAPARSQSEEQRKTPLRFRQRRHRKHFELCPERSVLLSKDMASGRAQPVWGREIPGPAELALLSTLSRERRVSGGGGLLKDWDLTPG